jgi:hypothetical protein
LGFYDKKAKEIHDLTNRLLHSIARNMLIISGLSMALKALGKCSKIFSKNEKNR